MAAMIAHRTPLRESARHRTVAVLCPRTNGFVERMNRTLLDARFRVTGRTARCLEPKQIQRDLDRFLAYYSLERSHEGYPLNGRTPAQAPREALEIDELPALCLADEEATTPAA